MRSLSGVACAVACAVLVAAAGCSDPGAQTKNANGSPSGSTSSSSGAVDPNGAGAPGDGSSPGTSESGAPSTPEGTPADQPDLEDLKVADPAALTKPLLSSDVLVYSRDTISQSTMDKIGKLKGVVHVEPFSMASFYVDERQVTYAAVNPSSFRLFTMPGTAQTQDVWDRVAGGEIAVEPRLAKKLQTDDGYLQLGNEADAKLAHIGAYAPILDPGYARHIDAVLNYKWVGPLGMTKNNALLVAMDNTAPQKIRKQLQQDAGNSASVQLLGPDLDLKAAQTAILTGGSVAAAIGKFNYTANSNGTINPDPKWVAANIRTELVPILGEVRCHKVMLLQLRAALLEIVARGLASKIHKDEYGGCYYPRFIAYSPSKGLSFHSFGTAIDLNVPGNGRGTAGEMDRTVVSIFKRWGFAWGGDWNYTDPMHFELSRLVHVG